MYRAFLAYLYSVACNLFEAYRAYDSLSQTFLPLGIEPNLNLEFTGANEFLAPIASKLKEDLVTEAAWNHGNCSERLHDLAEQLNHFELADGTPTYEILKSEKALWFNSDHWSNYARDLLEQPGNKLGYHGRSLEQGPFFLQ